MNADILSEPPALDDAMKYYPCAMWCTNCGKKNSRYIRKGVRVREVSTACEQCGCAIKG